MTGHNISLIIFRMRSNDMDNKYVDIKEEINREEIVKRSDILQDSTSSDEFELRKCGDMNFNQKNDKQLKLVQLNYSRLMVLSQLIYGLG